MSKPPSAGGGGAAQDWSVLGLSADEQAQLAGHRSEWPEVDSRCAEAEARAVWARVHEAPPAAADPRAGGTRRQRLAQLAWWLTRAQPGRLVAPALTALLLIAGELFASLLPRLPIGLDLWAVMAPWLGFWALGRGVATDAGVLGAWAAMAPLSAGRARLARWAGAAATGAGALAIALVYGRLTGSPALGLWAATAGLGFTASLAIGLATAVLIRPHRLGSVLTGLGLANLAAVLASGVLHRPDWAPVLLLLRAPAAVSAPAGLLLLGFGVWRARRAPAG